jgi:hypothetical protein
MNGYEVIDLLAYENIDDIINNYYVGLIITDLWKGPYSRKMYFESSTCYQILSTSFIKQNAFYGYLPNKVEEITSKFHPTKNLTWNPDNCNFFKFDVWKNSMDVIYAFNCLILLFIAFALQTYFLDLIDISVSTASYQTAWANTQSSLSIATLSSEIETLTTELLAIEEILLPELSVQLDMYKNFILMNMALSLYFVQNVLQMIFTKLTKKKVRIITPETAVNACSFFFSFYIVIRFYGHFAQIEVEEQKYYEMEVLNAAFNDKIIKGAVSTALSL